MFGSRSVAAGLLIAIAFMFAAAPASAETRTLKLYFIHTKERAEITYKRNGRYIQSGLNEINRFLRDWRRNEPTKMDPRLLDALWEVYRATGARDYIHVVSAYRSPQTNAMLRSRSSGVAKQSQHMLGKAVDFYIPGVKLASLRNAGLKLEAGGVGYYPRSGSPFIHLDVGNVRHWPRMSRKELMAVFPGGKTLHVPTDGKPLPGYQQALASYEARKRSGGTIQIANENTRPRGRGLLAALFGGGADEEEDIAESTTQVAAAAPRPQAQTARAAPEPQAPEPKAETPATILAALPARALPLPRTAPRPDVGVGTELAVASAAPTPAQQARAENPGSQPQAGAQEETALAEAPAPDEIPFQFAKPVPVPSPRPDHAAPAVQMAQVEADEDDDLPTATAFVTPTRRPEGSGPADAIAELLASNDGAPRDDAGSALTAAAEQDASPAAVPTEYVVAALADAVPEAKAAVVEAAKTVPMASSASTQGAVEKNAGPISSSPRLAMLEDASKGTASRAIAESARTTPKAAKPGPRDARPEPKPVVVPVKSVRGQLVLSRESVLNKTHRTKTPSFTPKIAEAPSAVYTDGFQQDGMVTDARRFTGKAVTFLSVAKFAAR